MKKSFTLIELLIVIAIIAIIAVGIIILIIPGQRLAQARDTTRASHLKNLETALYLYMTDEGEYPDTILDGELIEICNTEVEIPICTNLIDLSALGITIPVDPMGGVDSNGTGYFVALKNNKLVSKAPQAETKTVATGDVFMCGDEITFTYNEEEVTYGTVKNFTTGKCWLDRNLGANQVATASTDAAAYGDLFQWGRADDGHQIRTSSTTSILADSDTPGHENFILTSSSPLDWRSDNNDNRWNATPIVNNPCPDGWRVPTETELDNESQTWESEGWPGAFASPLKLTRAGYRSYMSGGIDGAGGVGYYWVSTISYTDSYRMILYSDLTSISPNPRSDGFSVRCIKN